MAEKFQCITLTFIFRMMHHKERETSPADNEIILSLEKTTCYRAFKACCI